MVTRVVTSVVTLVVTSVVTLVVTSVVTSVTGKKKKLISELCICLSAYFLSPNFQIHSLWFIIFGFSVHSQQSRLAQRQSTGLASNRSQVQTQLGQVFFFFF